MKILITGASGFIGKNLLPLLIESFSDIELQILTRDKELTSKKMNLSSFKNIEYIEYEDMSRVVKFNPEVVIHLATLSSPSNDPKIIKPIIATNIELGTLLLENLSHCSNFKLFLNMGSFSEYQDGQEFLKSATLYAASKSAFRHFLDYYSSLNNFSYLNIIPYSVYGGEMTIKRVIDYIKESLGSNTKIKMTRGNQILDFIHVNDVSDFLIYAIRNRSTISSLKKEERVFFLGTGVGTSIRECANIIQKKYKKPCNIEWGSIPITKRDIMLSVAPLDINSKSIKWKANISLKDGV